MTKHLIYMVCFSSLLFLISSKGLSQTTIVNGIVKNNDELLVGATISIGNKMTLSDNQGKFSVDVKPGNYVLIITHVGYKKFEQSISINTGTGFLEINLIKDEQIGEEVAVIGSRSRIQRSTLNTTVPIDVFSQSQLLQTNQVSLTQMLNFIAPSFNASREVYNEPASLRGLDPDHVLILMNGTRLHNTAWLNGGNLKGQLGRGSVGNDLNSIPFSAIDKIEILRDGASAQYGSDAIAGVFNIRLKETTDKTSIQLHTGQFYKGDGEKIYVGLNRGISLPKKGFINFSATFRNQAPTYRGGNYEGTVYSINKDRDDSIIRARNFNRLTAVSNVGNSNLNSFGFLINGGYNINNSTKLSLTASVNNRMIMYRGAYRFPKNTNQVNTILYPDGYKVKINTTTHDISGIAGIKGKTKNNWQWEFTSSYGSNWVDNHSSNTNNASQSYLGKNAPTAFYIGKQIYKQLTNDINFTKDIRRFHDCLKSLNIAFGAEWRLENYHNIAGEEASWNNYDASGKTQGGSQGFVGVHPANVVNKNRNAAGIYLDLEGELAKHFLFDIASRYEYYSDFGSNMAGKLSVLYKLSDKFSLRSSVSNGFRAPSLQQRYLSSFQTTWVRSGNGQIPGIRGIFSNDHEVTKALDIPKLFAEKALNMSGGITSSFSKHINFTLDAYWIQIKNRIILSGIFDRKKNPLIDAILLNYRDIDQIQFFTNAINTRTKGVDIVVNGSWKVNKTTLEVMFAANFTKTNLFGDIKITDKLPADSLNTNSLFNVEEKTKLERGQAASKIVFSITSRKGKTGFTLCNTHFGTTSTANIFTNPDNVLYESFSSKILTDFSFNYFPRKWLTVTAGVNNLFNVYPDRLKNYGNTVEGILIYSNEASPFGFNGGYYFVSMSFIF